MLIIWTAYKETFSNVLFLYGIIYMVLYRIRNRLYPFLNAIPYFKLCIILFISLVFPFLIKYKILNKKLYFFD